MASDTLIPVFYRIVFTIIDPFFCALGIAMHLFTKTDVLAALSPAAVVPVEILASRWRARGTSATVPPGSETVLLLDYLVGFFAMLGVLQVSLLRARPAYMYVWKALQFATLVLDVVQVAATARALLVQGRTEPSAWLGGGRQNFAGNAVFGLISARDRAGRDEDEDELSNSAIVAAGVTPM
ncbi:hypothetical protein DICSQDRAFT_170682 [Dichomitus squalens LYAD-421 SS1]|uniref:Uncharacterized protein n=1 Tax=Dichomitus squalens (strain LYAD-421) TaxID=732165 RepID=R7T0X2_DICSQ|nr:uncharacterized protein DICSQDRAFT_170682 [Dichomitus squalens LYAD-421 SS1]EJF60822.1 hypothetical protein DICSQDRAFT_170682 [Dichomitus squalens LYAD-421 SS1]